ncbi:MULTISPECIES: DEAD/DEAH box helicase [Flavobacterium]|uniref:DEAD/DEAH box helicase n=2 Tax=Flavobacterium TaxID=237 RepID=A0AA94F239_9FLAO|nr:MULTISPECIES: DEAD/DEAH box helicase [Flavobacterium]AMA49382.1 RNA helicase [Flavobacterium covae]MCH4828661.1 DEAD/DEAH box helicase [Flavobacterium columnare]MCH4831914.1 DEAD/DEAH box helicase [Flavobacterium columnare]MCJ1808026.1 DEAD/DEAH box helicase [Flavobacterium covae]OWP81435.1 RNA helicase [Flavobacterium covae]
MNLKKINQNLQKALIENNIIEPTELQSDCWGTLKGGADAIVVMNQGEGKSSTIAYTVIQKLEKPIGESTRALILVKDKESVLQMLDYFQKFGKHNDLRVIGVNDKTDIDEEKNVISAGMDILIGTPNKINAMFSGAGFNMNTVKIFVVDDADLIFKQRLEPIVQRLSLSVEKTQRLFFTTELTERVEILADKIMIEPYLFGVEYDEDEYNEE